MSTDLLREEGEDTLTLSERIARYAYILSLSVETMTADGRQITAIAIGLLNQAQAVADKNDMLATKLLNQARRLSRKMK